MFLPLLDEIISPAFVGLVLDIYLVVSEISFWPLIANDCTEPFKRAVKGPIDDAMVMKSMIGACFQYGDQTQTPDMLPGAATENSTFQPASEVTEIL